MVHADHLGNPGVARARSRLNSENCMDRLSMTWSISIRIIGTAGFQYPQSAVRLRRDRDFFQELGF